MSMTKKQKKKVGIVSLILILAVAVGVISLFAFRGGVGEQKTQYYEFNKKNVIVSGGSTLSDDGIVSLAAGQSNAVKFVVEAPATGVYKLSFDCMRTSEAASYEHVNVYSSAWGAGTVAVGNAELGDSIKGALK